MPTPDRTVQLPDQGYASLGRLTDPVVTIRCAGLPDRITLENVPGFHLSYSPESWAVIIPELVAALPADLRDDVANAICAMAGEMAS